ncbi:unnamed protein product [Ixodes pacificus]
MELRNAGIMFLSLLTSFVVRSMAYSHVRHGPVCVRLQPYKLNSGVIPCKSPCLLLQQNFRPRIASVWERNGSPCKIYVRGACFNGRCITQETRKPFARFRRNILQKAKAAMDYTTLLVNVAVPGGKKITGLVSKLSGGLIGDSKKSTGSSDDEWR